MKPCRLLTLILALLLWMPSSRAGAFTFHHPEKTRQLYGCNITALLEDNEGYLWIGTDKGLYRYDGYELYPQSSHTPSQVSTDQAVSSLQEDASHHLWIATSVASEYIVLAPDRQRIDTHAYLQQLGMNPGQPLLVHVDHSGDLWCITTDTISHYDFANRKCTSIPAPGLPSANNQRIAVRDAHGSLYILDGRQLWTYNQQYGAWQQEELDLELPSLGSASASLMLTDCFVDHQGGLWVYSLFSEAILHKAPTSREWTAIHLPTDATVMQNSIRCMAEDADTGVWIATDHRSLFLYQPTDGSIVQVAHQAGNPHSPKSGNVTQLLVDSHQTLWLGYFRNGISYCQSKVQMPHSHEGPYGEVTALLADTDHNRWIGTDGRGLWHEWPDGRLQQITSIPNLTVTDLQHDQQGRLWIGTYDHGIYCLDGQRKLRHYDAQSGQLPHDVVQRMAIDSKGRLWVCSAFCKFYCFNTQTETYRILSGEEKNDLMGQAVCFDARGERILLATFYGLWAHDLQRETGHRVFGARHDSIPFHEFQVTNMIADDFSPLIWMGHSQGITVWDTQADTLYLISRAQGLNGAIQAIRQDLDHNVWISTVSGLAMISSTHQADGSWNFRVRNFLSTDDQRNFLFNPYAGAVTRQGQMLFGGPDGYVELDTKTMLAAPEEAVEARFSSIHLGDSILQPEQLTQLHYGDHSLNLTFYTGNPLNAMDTRYAYRIQGLQDQWIETRSNTLSLLTLPTGDYQIELKARGRSGEWSPVSILPMRVSPPWWFAPWIWGVYALILVALGIALVMITRTRQRRKAMNEKKMLIREQQANLAEMKLQFFTDISHDLRTPLTLIISPLEQLLKDKLPDQVNHRLQNMHKNAQQLLAEVNTLLDFRKLDVGAEKLRPGQPSDIISFIRNHGDQYYDLARDRKVTFRVQLPQEPVITAFDEDKLRKILYNLLSNAFKHSPDEGEVALQVHINEEGMIQTEVIDQGPGIPDAEKHRIFELFYQSSSENPKPGSGIGLHIVRQFVALHNGKLWIEDNKPQGAIFCFTLPIINNEDVESQPTPAEKKDNNKADEPTVARTAGEKPAILVVDDNEDLCHFIEESLMNEYIVHCAYNGEQALRTLDHETIDLVVSDIMMPGISGLELCNRIKSDLHYSHIPVILLTARAAEQSVMEGLQQGADDYLTKPFNVDRLRLRIAKFIEWSRLSHQNFQQKTLIEPREITITPLDEQFLQQAIDLVNDNLQNAEFNVESLAAGVAMSRSQLYKKLMAVTGKSPLDFIRTMRMKRAKVLLEKSQMQITEIAYLVGFNTLKTFSENFKQEYGLTPSEYIKENQRKDAMEQRAEK